MSKCAIYVTFSLFYFFAGLLGDYEVDVSWTAACHTSFCAGHAGEYAFSLFLLYRSRVRPDG